MLPPAAGSAMTFTELELTAVVLRNILLGKREWFWLTAARGEVKPRSVSRQVARLRQELLSSALQQLIGSSER
eukprot:4425253-Pleurochrysis_carterae.AAC.1